MDSGSVSVGVQTEAEDETFFCNNEHCDHFGVFGADKENNNNDNFLWFICPLCCAAFPRQESKLIRHKEEVHGICRKNRTAYIMSQTDLNPNVMLHLHPTAAPLTRSRSPSKIAPETEKVKVNLEFVPCPTMLEMKLEEGLSGGSGNVDLSIDEPSWIHVDVDPMDPAEPEDVDPLAAVDMDMDVTSPVAVVDILEVEQKQPAPTPQPSPSPSSSAQSSTTHKCGFCHKSFDNAPSWVQHEMFQHKNEKAPYRCESCPKTFTTKKVLKFHVTGAHSGPTPTPPAYECKACNKRLNSLPSYKAHLSTHSSEKPFLCSTCGKAFRTRSFMDSHADKMHLGVVVPRRFTCDICGYKSSTPSLLKIHSVRHQTERPCACEICGKTFKDLTALKTHAKSHTGQRKRFACQLCDERFTLREVLVAHERLKHCTTGEPEFNHACSICGKKFIIERYCRSHELRHDSAARKHLCTICGRAFLDAKGARRHEKVHQTGGRTRNRKIVLELVDFTEQQELILPS